MEGSLAILGGGVMRNRVISTAAVLCVLGAALVVPPSQAVAGEAFAASLEWTRCWFKGGPDWPRADCGTLRVLEKRDHPNGSTVTLPFIVFRAHSPRLGEAPVLVTGGGGPGGPMGMDPGDPTEMDKQIWYANFYMSVDDGRDLIVMDNRGVGSSRPRLDCPEVERNEVLSLQSRMTFEDYAQAMAGSYKRCKQRLADRGVDVAAYNNLSAALDIEDLRRLLGLRQLNLHGVSYGTRIALTYLREFPENVHALVLDGIEGPELMYYEVAPQAHIAAIERVFHLCREDDPCRARYGEDLYARFVELLGDLEAEPILLRVTDPRDLRPMEVWLTPEVLLRAIFSTIYDKANIGSIPRALMAAMEGSTDYAAELVRDQVVRAVTVDSLDEGAYASYQCHDEASFTDFSKALEAASAHPLQKYLGIPWLHSEMTMCKSWGVVSDDSKESEPVVSKVPALLYSGQLDPTTPAPWALSVAQHLPNARVKEWDGIAHGVLAISACADRVAAAFLSDPQEDPFDFDCLSDENPVSFELY